MGKVFGGAAEYKDQCWSPFLLLAQSVAKDHLDQFYYCAPERTASGTPGKSSPIQPALFFSWGF